MNKSQGSPTRRRRDAGSQRAPTRSRDGTARREQFIEVALRLFSGRGRAYADISVEEIAAEAGAAKGLLYYYFGDKRGLYLAGLERLAEEMFQRFSVIAEDTEAEPLQRLMQGLDAHLSFIESYPDGYSELIASAGSHPEIQEILERGQAVILDLIVSNLPPEVPRTPLIELAIRGWGGFVDRFELAWIADGGATREQIKEVCSRMIVAAIAAAVEVSNAQPIAGKESVAKKARVRNGAGAARKAGANGRARSARKPRAET